MNQYRLYNVTYHVDIVPPIDINDPLYRNAVNDKSMCNNISNAHCCGFHHWDVGTGVSRSIKDALYVMNPACDYTICIHSHYISIRTYAAVNITEILANIDHLLPHSHKLIYRLRNWKSYLTFTTPRDPPHMPHGNLGHRISYVCPQSRATLQNTILEYEKRHGKIRTLAKSVL